MESILGKDCTRWWIDFIKEKKSYGLYHDNDCIAVACLKFCFMLILRDELHRAARLWSLEFDLQQTRNPHLGGLMYYSFSRKCPVQGTV